MNEYHERLSELVDSLIEKTEAGALRWKLTDRPGAFLYSGANGGVILGSAEDDGLPPFVVQILDTNGVVVEDYEDPGWWGVHDEPRQTPVAALYELVRDLLRPSNPVITSLLEEVRSA